MIFKIMLAVNAGAFVANGLIFTAALNRGHYATCALAMALGVGCVVMGLVCGQRIGLWA